ncbi:ATP-binding cassette domain-containing protein [Nocardia sp. BMG51109]|uniref:ATP-binding cassette domain-containing protein n=1 Tax=Nocardia sp. BMG51109 TaxID=1056816 RepID=UPI000463D6EB|nr:ABC transporter ATP-binding protein [Nocardia sp. BMG51109]
MSAARPPAFAATELTKRFEGVHAVREVSFVVPSGTTAALIGPPGSGKTTIVRMLLGLLPPTAGTAAIGGGPARRTGSPAGAMLQPRGLHPARTVRGQLRVYAAAASASDDQVDELLALTNLEAVAGQRIRALPPGVQTRLALAIALLGDPPLLVLDDPLAGLGPAECDWLSEFLRRRARRGGATLLTSQSLAAAIPVVDQLIVLADGAVVYQGSPRRLRRSHPDRLIVGVSSPIALATTLAARGFTDTVMRSDGRLAVAEATRAEVEAAASTARVQLTELIPEPVHPDRVLAALTRPAQPPTTAPPMPYGTPP